MTQLFEAESRGFDSRWSHCNFPLANLPALGSTQPLTEMSTRNIFWGVKAAGRLADHLTTFTCRLSRNWEPQPPGTLRACLGLYRFYLYLYGAQWRYRRVNITDVFRLPIPISINISTVITLPFHYSPPHSSECSVSSSSFSNRPFSWRYI
jgi:hypothetical protein